MERNDLPLRNQFAPPLPLREIKAIGKRPLFRLRKSVLAILVVATACSAPGKAVSVMRMTRDTFTSQRGAAGVPLHFGKEAPWQVESGGTAGGGPAYGLDVSLEAKDYNFVRFSMKADAGKIATLAWESDYEPRLQDNPGVSTPILADNDVHEYRLPLNLGACETWAGHVHRLRLQVSDEPGKATLEDFEFSFVPPEVPARVTLGNQNHEALSGDLCSWKVVLPPHAIFETYVGMRERAWNSLHSDGVRMVAFLDVPDMPRRPLVAVDMKPVEDPRHRSWIPLRVDLSDVSGKQAEITLIMEHGASREGDYAFWGNPMICRATPSQGGDDTRVDAPGEDTPVILISVDTLRADHLPFYGYGRNTAPHLSAWLPETVVFDKAICQEAWTLTSHMTMLTGLYPKNHRVTPNTNLAESVTTVPEALAAQGYRTAGFASMNPWLLASRGYGQGFDLYDVPASVRPASVTLPLAQAWLRDAPSPRLFLFVHFFDLHFKSEGESPRPYDPGDSSFHVFSEEVEKRARETAALNTAPASAGTAAVVYDSTVFLGIQKGKIDLAPKVREHLIACYDDCILSVDSAISKLFDTLKRQDLYDRALIIVTADHGEEFDDHGRYQHLQAYQECVHVPLLIKFPRGRFAGRHVRETVQLVDLAPTIRDAVGAVFPKPPQDSETSVWGGFGKTAPTLGGESFPACDGQSLVRLLEGTETPRNHAFSQRNVFQLYSEGAFDLVRNVHLNTFALFNVASDPSGQTDVSAAFPDVRAKMESSLTEFFVPDDEGWRFVLRGNGENWSGDVRVATDDRFTSARLVRAAHTDFETLDMTDTIVKVHIAFGPRYQQEDLLIKTASPGAHIIVSLTSDSPFCVPGGEGGWKQATHYDVTLDPADTASVEPASKTPAPPIPRLSFTHRDEKAKQPAALPLSPDATVQLKALGYL